MLETKTRLWGAAAAATLAIALVLALSLAPSLSAQGSLAADVDPALDARIEATLTARYQRLDGLDEVTVDVAAGVVVLEGEARGFEAASQAIDIARRTEGVAEVVDRIKVSADIRDRLGPAADELSEAAKTTIAYLPLLVVAILVVFAFYVLSRLVMRLDGLYSRFLPNRLARDVARRIVGFAVVLIGVVLALDLLNATALVGAVLGTAGVVGVALGFAFRDLAENYIASILLSFRQPFAANDFVEIGPHKGKVIRLTSRATILMTLDGNHLRIPNAEVYKGVILNYTRNPMRRFDFVVGVGVGEDLAAVRTIGVETLRRMEGVAGEPPPLAVVTQLGDSSVSVQLFAWVDQRAADFTLVQSEAIRLVKEAFDDAGIDMPEPSYRLRMVSGDEAAAAGEQPAARRPRAPSEATEPAAVGVGESSTEAAIDRQIAAERTAGEGATDLLESGATLE